MIPDSRSSGDGATIPPGQHPATAPLREQLAYAERKKREAERKSFEVGVPFDTSGFDEFIAYAKGKLAEFEAGEDRAKREWLERYGAPG